MTARALRWLPWAGRGLTASLAVILLAACTSEPLTPEERHALEMDTYCRGIAEDARTQHMAKREAGEVDEIGNNDPLWQEATAGSDPEVTFQAAYNACMEENKPQ